MQLQIKYAHLYSLHHNRLNYEVYGIISGQCKHVVAGGTLQVAERPHLQSFEKLGSTTLCNSAQTIHQLLPSHSNTGIPA